VKNIFFTILAMMFLGANAVNAQRYPSQLTPRQDSIAKAIFADTTLPSFDNIPPNNALDYEEDCVPLFLPFDHKTPSVLVEMCAKEETDTTSFIRVRVVDISETNFVLLGSVGIYLSSSKSAQDHYESRCYAELDEGFYVYGKEPTDKWLSMDEKTQLDEQSIVIELICPILWENLANRMLDHAYRKVEQ